MRKVLNAFVLTIILSVTVWAGEMPNGIAPPPPPPPPAPGSLTSSTEDLGDNQVYTTEASEETVTDYILNLIQGVLALY